MEAPEITEPTTSSIRLQARIAGVLYLFLIAGGIFAEPCSPPARCSRATPRPRCTTSRPTNCFIAWASRSRSPHHRRLYNLFKVVNRNFALMMVTLDLVINTLESVSLLFHFAPLLFLGSSHHLSVFTPDQLQAASYLSIELFEHGFAICLVVFGFDCLAMASPISNKW
jgi:hypothetical protein